MQAEVYSCSIDWGFKVEKVKVDFNDERLIMTMGSGGEKNFWEIVQKKKIVNVYSMPGKGNTDILVVNKNTLEMFTESKSGFRIPITHCY